MNDVIVVGTDGSDTANVAVQRAATLAKLTGARVELVSGYREDYALAAGTGMYVGDLAGDARTAADGFLESTATRLRDDGLDVETHCMGGDPSYVRSDSVEATGATRSVGGSKGMHGSRRFL